jgi:hypothetical protein
MLVTRTIGFMAMTLGLQVAAVNLKIYTPSNYHFTIRTLKEDWTVDTRTRGDFGGDSPDIPIPGKDKKGVNLYALTGLMEWKGAHFEKRAFWVEFREGAQHDKAFRWWSKVRHLVLGRTLDLLTSSVHCRICSPRQAVVSRCLGVLGPGQY